MADNRPAGSAGLAPVPGVGTLLRSLLPQGMALAPAAWNARHRFVLWSIGLACLALPAIGAARAWRLDLLLGETVLVAAAGVAAAAPSLDRRLRSVLAAAALCLAAAILVQVTAGAAQAHYAYFVVVALVALYQDWTPFLSTFGLIVALNVLVGAFEPAWISSAADGRPWNWLLLHLLALAAEGIALLALWSGVEQARARSDLVLDSAGEGILGLDSSGTVTFANPAARSIFARAGDLVGQGILELMAGTRFTLAATLQGTPESGMLATRRGPVPVEWMLTPTVRSGVPIGFVLVLRDVRMRRDLERRLEERNRQQALVANLGHTALRSRLDDFLAEATAAVAQALAVSHCAIFERVPGRRELWLRAGVGWPASLQGSLIATEAGALERSTAALSSSLLAEQGIASGMVVALDARGATFGAFAAHHTAQRPFTQDEAHFLQAVANLVASAVERHLAEAELEEHRRNLEATVQRRTSQLTEAMRELEAFSYTVSHDLRSPLRAIDGFSRILQRRHGDDLPAESRQMLDLLSQGAVRMGQLIESVLALARIGRVEVQENDVDLSRMALDILAELAAKDRDRDVDVHVEPGLVVRGDEGLLRLALQNLLDNAWKFTGQTLPARIEVRRGPEGSFVVQDNGAGFDMAYAHGLFQPFHRLHEAGQFEGTGIGLATVQRVVQRHGGRIWAEAEPGRGARFAFTLGSPRAATDLVAWRSRLAEDRLGTAAHAANAR